MSSSKFKLVTPIVVLAVLAGCSSHTKAPTVTVTPTTTVATTPVTTDPTTTDPAPTTTTVPLYAPTVMRYLKATRALPTGDSDATLVSIGKSICLALSEDGATYQSTEQRVVAEYGLSGSQEAELILASAQAFCPSKVSLAVAPKPKPKTPSAKDTKFIKFLSDYPHGGLAIYTASGYSHRYLISTAHTICSSYQTGASITAIVTVLVNRSPTLPAVGSRPDHKRSTA